MEEKYKILCVEDDKEMLDLLKEAVESLDYEAVLAKDVDQALEKLKEYKGEVILVISDYTMPGKTGLNLRQAMMDDNDEIPFIMVTGHGSKELAIESITYNISAFIEKPCDIDDLCTTIEEHASRQVKFLVDEKELYNSFLEETISYLEEIEDNILFFGQNPNSPDTIDTIFRLAHTIKGTSSFMGYKQIESFAHVYEEFLTNIKNRSFTNIDPISQTLLYGYDCLAQMIDNMEKKSSEVLPVESWVEDLKKKSEEALKVIVEDKKKQAESPTAAKKGKEEGHFVPARLLDEFLELSSELTVIRNSMDNILKQMVHELEESEHLDMLNESFGGMQKISGQIQNKIVELRKIELKTVFKSLPRIVRDLGNTTSKDIILNIQGDELRVDKSITQVLNKILVHMVRNSADHGIETGPERIEAGKDPKGTINLTAQSFNEEVLITIQDDGKGLDRQAISQKAVNNGLYTEQEINSLPDSQVFDLIFQAGLSTAREVTNISGRGVGMDMVRSSIEEMKGEIEIQSEKGIGTTFNLHLPVPKSVLIADSLLFRTGSYQYAVPIESVKYVGTQPIKTAGQKPIIKYEESVYFLWNINNLIQNTMNQVNPGEEELILLLQSDDEVTGFVIDECIGQFEIVIRPFDKFLADFENFKGTALLDNSKMCLVIDPEKLINQALTLEPNISAQNLVA